MEVVAAGVMDGKIVTVPCMHAAGICHPLEVRKSARRIAGHTTRGVAASMTTRRTFIDLGLCNVNASDEACRGQRDGRC